MSYSTVSLSRQIKPLDWDGKTIGEIKKMLDEQLEELGVMDRLDYFSVGGVNDELVGLKIPETMNGSYNWITAWACQGGSEGYYVHVEVVGSIPEHLDSLELRQMAVRASRCIFLAKTFESLEFACDVAKILTILLDW